MDYREEIIKTLIEAKISSPRLEADIILRAVAPNYPEMTLQEKGKADEYTQRRCKHEPLDKDDKLYSVSKDKLLITNHSGDFTTDYIDQAYELLLQNIKSFIKTGKLSTIVRKQLGY